MTNADRKYWSPVDQLVERLSTKYMDKAVLEIGPGHARFPAAKHFVDWQDVPGIPIDRTTKVDVGKDRLPFTDKMWDFVYCRHVLEDMYNPFLLLSEMSRVAKEGYIETPSPICELTRGVDGNSPPYRGYNHHRWIVWERNGELGFVSKYPLIEYSTFDDPRHELLLRSGPQYWNTYYLWSGDIKVAHLQCPHDFRMPEDYATLLTGVALQSKESTDRFWQQIQGGQVVQMQRAVA